MTKRSALLSCTVIALAAAIAACSSSTSPGNGTKPPGSASKGDSLNLSGSYNLTAIVLDSADGGTSTLTADANDGGTLVLTSAAYSLTWTGFFLQGSQNTHGSYVAVDTSSTVQRGTIVLYDSVKAKSQNAWYAYSGDTLTVAVPNNNGNGTSNGTEVTFWIKQ
jgi:hypothetical protein